MQDAISSYGVAAASAAHHLPRSAPGDPGSASAGRTSSCGVALAATLPAACAADPDPFLLSSSATHEVDGRPRQLPASHASQTGTSSGDVAPWTRLADSSVSASDARALGGSEVPDWERGVLKCQAAVPTHAVFLLPPPLASRFASGRPNSISGGAEVPHGEHLGPLAVRLQRQMPAAAAEPIWQAALPPAGQHRRCGPGHHQHKSRQPPPGGHSAAAADPGSGTTHLLPGSPSRGAVAPIGRGSGEPEPAARQLRPPAGAKGAGAASLALGGNANPLVVRVDEQQLAGYAVGALQVGEGIFLSSVHFMLLICDNDLSDRHIIVMQETCHGHMLPQHTQDSIRHAGQAWSTHKLDCPNSPACRVYLLPSGCCLMPQARICSGGCRRRALASCTSLQLQVWH